MNIPTNYHPPSLWMPPPRRGNFSREWGPLGWHKGTLASKTTVAASAAKLRSAIANMTEEARERFLSAPQNGMPSLMQLPQ